MLSETEARLIPTPKILLDLKGLSGLDYIGYDQGQGCESSPGLYISVGLSPAVQERFAVLAQGSSASLPTRFKNRATVVGNICSGVPPADAAPACSAWGQTVMRRHPGERLIDIEDFFTGPRQTTAGR